MKPEKQQLLHDLLAGPDRREAAMLAGSRALRRRRHRRIAGKSFLVLMMIAIAAVWIDRPSRKPRIDASVPAAKPAVMIDQKSLTDDELLALFPGTPVGLVTLADGKKRLIFPRSGDEQKFVTRL